MYYLLDQFISLALQRAELLIEVLEHSLCSLGDCLLMVTQDGHLSVRSVVLHHLVLDSHTFQRLSCGQLAFQSDGGVESTEDLGGEALHEGVEVLVQHGRGERVEDLLGGRLALAEALEVCIDKLAEVSVLREVDVLLVLHAILTCTTKRTVVTQELK